MHVHPLNVTNATVVGKFQCDRVVIRVLLYSRMCAFVAKMFGLILIQQRRQPKPYNPWVDLLLLSLLEWWTRALWWSSDPRTDSCSWLIKKYLFYTRGTASCSFTDNSSIHKVHMYTCSHHRMLKVAFHANLMFHRLTLRRHLNEMEFWVQIPVEQTVSPKPSETAYAHW